MSPKTEVQVLNIGGGRVGSSILYLLAKVSWTDNTGNRQGYRLPVQL